MGIVTFAAVSFVIKPADVAERNLSLVWILAGFGIMTAIVRMVVPSLIVGQARKRVAAGTFETPGSANSALLTDEDKLAAIFQTQIIIASALLEAGALANVTAFLMHRQWPSLVLAGVLLVGVLIDFPTQRSAEEWVERQKRLMREEQMLGRP
jgi:hypothetical protein